MSLKLKLRQIIFGIKTPAGRLFDIILIFAIFGSITVVMLDSVKDIHESFGPTLISLEWFFTILFTIEYFSRVYVAKDPIKYITSFYGVIDLLSTIPTYIAFFVPGGQTLLMLRVFRLIRIFRIFKLGHYVKGSDFLVKSLIENRGKIIAFLLSVLTVVMIIGSLMYIIEGYENGFTSIPRSIYWAIVTVTTVGFGDISPQTSLGQFFASMLMLIGYSIIAVPTGIISSGMMKKRKKSNTKGNKDTSTTKICSRCQTDLHSENDNYCWKCGEIVQ